MCLRTKITIAILYYRMLCARPRLSLLSVSVSVSSLSLSLPPTLNYPPHPPLQNPVVVFPIPIPAAAVIVVILLDPDPIFTFPCPFTLTVFALAPYTLFIILPLGQNATTMFPPTLAQPGMDMSSTPVRWGAWLVSVGNIVSHRSSLGSGNRMIVVFDGCGLRNACTALKEINARRKTAYFYFPPFSCIERECEGWTRQDSQASKSSLLAHRISPHVSCCIGAASSVSQVPPAERGRASDAKS